MFVFSLDAGEVAKRVGTSISNFNNNLSSNDTTVQKALDTLDDMAGGGDVTGPASSIDNAVARFNSTSGKIIQAYTSGSPTCGDTGICTFSQTIIGSINGNAATATALAADPANCAAGSGAGGINASGEAEDCIDFIQQSELLDEDAMGTDSATQPASQQSIKAYAIQDTADIIKDTHPDWGTGANQISAVDIPIADAGVIITATEVEGALQENRTAIDLNTAKQTNTDDQTIDVFSVSGNNVQLSLEADGEATKTVDISTTTAVAANTSKTTNATHTGEVTGSGALAVDPTAISGKVDVTSTDLDYMLIIDQSDSWALKKVDMAEVRGGGAETNDLESVATNAATNEIFVGSGANAGAYIGITACAADEKIEYTDGAPNTFTCEAIGSLVDADISDTLTASIIDLEAGTITNILVDELPLGVGNNDVTYKAVPDCDGNGSALNYDVTGHAFSCKTLADADMPDNTTVTGWTMGTSIATTPAEGDNDTSLATTAYVIAETADILDGTDAFTDFNGTDIIDSDNYNTDSIDNEHINWADIDNLGDEGVIPSGATVADPNAAGELAIDTTTDQFLYYGGAQRVLTYRYTDCKTLETPEDADDNIPVWAFPEARTITDVHCYTEGGTSIAVTISDGTNALEAVTCDADGADDDGSIANGTFTANENIEWDFGAPTGTVDWVKVCITTIITTD